MMEGYRIRLAPKNEGIEYADDSGVYRFDIALDNKEWTIFLPCTKGDRYERYILNNEDEMRILGRVILYLKSVKWFGIFPVKYSVVVKRAEP